MTPNAQQQAVLEWGRTGSGSLNLLAYAGCGKTSTIIELAKSIPSNQRVFLGAFNKAIATELQSRLNGSTNVIASTMHSAGFGLWRRMGYTRSEIDSRKVRNLAKTLYPFDKRLVDVTVDAVSFAKQAGFGIEGRLIENGSCPSITDQAAWTEIMDYYDLWDEVPDGVSPDRVINGCIAVYQQSLASALNRQDSKIDFDDMILLPLLHGSGDWMRQYDWVMIDEAQDTNKVRRVLAMSILKPNGRLVAVGDTHQAIYGFAGASSDSMQQIKDAMRASELPLSMTYRCPQSVVKLAQTWVTDFSAHEHNPEGTVTTIDTTDFLRTEFRPTDVILCRNTRPLLGVAERLRAAGVACIVEGVNGKGMISLASKWGTDISIRELDMRLDDWLVLERAKWEAKERLDRVEAAEERVQSIRQFMARFHDDRDVADLVRYLEDLFKEDYRGNILRLCTIHRSKGREWDRVFLVGRNEYQPSRWAKKPWELEQEKNLMYVAVTRAKSELVEVRVPKKKAAGDPDWWER